MMLFSFNILSNSATTATGPATTHNRGPLINEMDRSAGSRGSNSFSGSVTAVAWTAAEDAGVGDGESDGEGDGDGVDEGGELDDEGDGGPGVTEGVGARAAGRQALAVSVSAARALTNAASRRMVRL